MRISSKYLVTDIMQTGLWCFLISYFLVTRPPESEKVDILTLTEELVWFIAKLFLIGIALTLTFLATYFSLYLCRSCLGHGKHASRIRADISGFATTLVSMYPGWALVHEVWTEMLGRMYSIGLDPVYRAFSDPEEVSVFYCVILCVFWICFSTAFFLFMVAGFANARSTTRAINYFLGNNTSEEEEDN